MTNPAIRVEGLRKHYGSVKALDGIDFEVPPGTVFGLLGPNGAGKTTAVRILATVLRADGGKAEVLGLDVAHHADAVRYQIGLAGQYAAVDENLTGRENLRLTGRLAQMDKSELRQRADELLELFDLTPAGDRTVRTYSGGMRRRLDVAAALLQQPPVLFLDEPTTGLDLPSRNGLWDQIRELVRRGTTILLTTQYLEEADRLADRVAVVDGGKIVANDTPEMLKRNLGNTVIEMRFNGEERAITALPLMTPLTTSAPDREGDLIRLATDDASHLLITGLRVLDEHGLAPRNLSVREPSMDDVFLALTGHRTGAGLDSSSSADGSVT